MRLIGTGLLGLLVAGCASSSSPGISTSATSIKGAPPVHVQAIPQTSPVARKKSTVRGGSSAALPTVVAAAQPTPTTIPRKDFTAILHGTVRDARSHKPLKGAVVRIVYGRAKAVTDTGGRYNLKFPKDVNMPVMVDKKGYTGQLEMGRLLSHQSYRLNFELHSKQHNQSSAPSPPSVFGQD
ncbi:MAG: carboxypeptidase regulatory-like domain-containing protein [Chloroflexota bacterium]